MRRAHCKVLSVVGAAALVLGGIVVLSAAPAAGVTQATVTNNSNSGPGSLRQAILDANAGGPNQADDAQITIPASVGNISLSSQLTYDGGSGSAHNIEIIGNGQTITQTAAGNAVLLLLTKGATTVTGLTLTGVSNSSALLGLAPGALTVRNSTITGNHSNTFAGAIFGGAAVTIIDSTISGNSAMLGAGAVYTPSTLTVTGSTFTLNQTQSGNGGAILAVTNLIATNSTITNNSAGSGGGIAAGSAATLSYVTLVGNTAPVAANLATGSTVALQSFGTVIAQPLGGGANCVLHQTTTSTYSWDDDGSCGFTGTGDHSNAGNSGLGALGTNGGPTQTILPQTGSGLIDKIPAASPCGGVNITVDQRGLPRPTTAGSFCDIGAVEVQPPPTSLTARFTG